MQQPVLSQRQQSVADLAIAGLTDNEIAERKHGIGVHQ